MKLNRSRLLAKAMEFVEYDDAYMGICLECGTEHDGVDPDSTDQECRECGSATVFGAEQIIMELAC